VRRFFFQSTPKAWPSTLLPLIISGTDAGALPRATVLGKTYVLAAIVVSKTATIIVATLAVVRSFQICSSYWTSRF
jgi:hypothetical protein